MVFDNATRQTCVVKAARTNTPLHALTTMNETTFVESARVLAQRVLADKSLSDDRERFGKAWLLSTGRRPNPEEERTLQSTIEKLRVKYSGDEAAAKQLLAVGESPRDTSLDAREHAAWAGLCLMVLNLDEVVTKE